MGSDYCFSRQFRLVRRINFTRLRECNRSEGRGDAPAVFLRHSGKEEVVLRAAEPRLPRTTSFFHFLCCIEEEVQGGRAGVSLEKQPACWCTYAVFRNSVIHIQGQSHQGTFKAASITSTLGRVHTNNSNTFKQNLCIRLVLTVSRAS